MVTENASQVAVDAMVACIVGTVLNVTLLLFSFSVLTLCTNKHASSNVRILSFLFILYFIRLQVNPGGHVHQQRESGSEVTNLRVHFTSNSTCYSIWNRFWHLNINTGWKLICAVWHRCRCTACVACHMMWHASWLSVTFVKTGFMEGRQFVRFENVLTVVIVAWVLWLYSVFDPLQFSHLILSKIWMFSL